MSRQVVRDEGAEAFRQGRKVEQNPYIMGTDARLEWTFGFMSEKHKRAKPQT
ncbi:hypothetical protein AB4Z27_27960 [Cupriavidus sp. KB_39]|uniref:hypothetical protein n=1 Tax=Cupriavidus sp. KB_39 TaxID=3233036 RepID=UPI003F8F49B0